MKPNSFSACWTVPSEPSPRCSHRRPRFRRRVPLSGSGQDRSQGRNVARVGAGILITRVLGFVRERVFAQHFGVGAEADAFSAAMKIPNVIRVLLGEGTLSASFIPVYAGMIERGEHENASKLAGVMASILVLLTAAAALLGYVLAPIITDVAAPGFSGDKRDLTITLVRILFPMSGALILSAWCLGILNTHRRFFLSYAAPAVWNIAQIITLVALGAHLFGAPLAVALAWGAVAGSVLQIVIQLPVVLPLVKGSRLGLDLDTPGVRKVIRAWIPVVLGAGVVQVSSLLDTLLASLLPTGSMTAIHYAQLLALLPVSLFGVGVAAVALPELSRDATGATQDALRSRLATGLTQLVYFVIPSAFALAAIGSQMVGALLQTGAFDSDGTALVAGVLAAYALAVPAQTSIKLLASGHYALGDTKTPVRIAIVAVIISAGSAFGLMQVFGPAGIALGAAIGAYVNVLLNSLTLKKKLGAFVQESDWRLLLMAGFSAMLAVAVSVRVAALLAETHIWVEAIGAMFSFALIYAVATLLMGHPVARNVLESAMGRARS